MEPTRRDRLMDDVRRVALAQPLPRVEVIRARCTTDRRWQGDLCVVLFSKPAVTGRTRRLAWRLFVATIHGKRGTQNARSGHRQRLAKAVLRWLGRTAPDVLTEALLRVARGGAVENAMYRRAEGVFALGHHSWPPFDEDGDTELWPGAAEFCGVP